MRQIALVLVGLGIGLGAACGDNEVSLADFYPELPPTGGAAIASAGQVTDPSQLVTGPAQSGTIGDYFIKNDVATFIVQSPARVIGVIPQGGNVVDAVLTDGTNQLVPDQFGELALVYLLGRTCEPDHIDIVRDGTDGGAAVLRSVGKSGNDDFIDFKGIGVLPVDEGIDPDIGDNLQCATTYVLAPGSTTLEVYHSLFNPGPDPINGPMGTIADTGGSTDAWTNTRGFVRADLSNISTIADNSPMDYVVYQAPGVAYGVIPRHAEPTLHTQILIAGVSVIVDGNDNFLDIINRTKYFLHLPVRTGVLQRYDLVVGRDTSDVDKVYRAFSSQKVTDISGTITWTDGTPAVGARVGVFLDGNMNGMLDEDTVDLDGDGLPDDRALMYMDVAADGTYHGSVPTTGNLFVRAEVKNVGRSQAVPAAATVDLTVPSPLKIDFQIVDRATGLPIPGRLIVIGDHPVYPDERVFEVFDRADGIVTQEHAIRGTTIDLGDGADAALELPASGTYRIYASRGTEWSVDSQAVSASGMYTFTLDHVVPTPGYYATDWHVHQVGSPDSNVASDERIRSAVSSGVEIFAVTDHDFISDLEPLVQSMGLGSLVRVVAGEECTPFAYGHYNAWPIVPDSTSVIGGAVDWARGAALGYAMTPGEVYSALQARGAQMVQVNHPRVTGFSEFQGAFMRANVRYDFDARTIYGDYMNANVPNDFLRLPGESLWSDNFNGLEIWNGFSIVDSNGDGLRENQSLDNVMHDWLSMLSLGFYVTPAGDSDTHTITTNPLGMPRTYVRVADDSVDGITTGTAIDAVVATQTGANGAARDVVVTDGPMIDVEVAGQPALGRVVSSVGQPVTLDVTVTSADWAAFDTVEVFANTTPDALDSSPDTTLVPLECWTSRTIANLNASDPCMRAAIAPQTMTVDLQVLPTGGRRFQATLHVTLDAQDIVNRAGATGQDAWLVFRARGNTGIFPILTNNGAVTDATMPVLLSGNLDAIRVALAGKGTPAEAVAAPVFVDFDGGGYRAPFAP